MTDREGLFSKGRNPNSSQPVARPLTFKYRFCKAGERALHRDILLWGCFVTRFKTSLPFYVVMPSFTSFGKKTLAVLCLSFKTLKCYETLFRGFRSDTNNSHDRWPVVLANHFSFEIGFVCL
ncbi:MAG: hypothetical protein V1689_10100 [Pseudomonadota bacterium]